MNTVSILRAALATIEDPKHWTQGRDARKANGESALWCHPSAECWCARGAVLKVAEISPGMRDAVRELETDLGGNALSVFNDSHTHSEVIELFQRTISRLESEMP